MSTVRVRQLRQLLILKGFIAIILTILTAECFLKAISHIHNNSSPWWVLLWGLLSAAYSVCLVDNWIDIKHVAEELKEEESNAV